MKRVIDMIGSRRFAILILLITTAVILAANLLPKPYILTGAELSALKRERPAIYALSRRFNVQEVTKSPLFAGVAIFLFASIAVCTARRAKRRLDRADERMPPVTALPLRHEFHMTSGEKALLPGRASLPSGWGWLRGEAGEGTVYYAKKGEGGFWGSAAFHAGMLVVLLGVLVSTFTRYNGRLVLTEDFDIEPTKALKGLSKNERYVFPVRDMVLKSFSPVYEGAFPVDYAARFMNQDVYGRVQEETVRVNEPMKAGGYEFILTRYGFAPRFVLRDREGKVVSDDVVNLVVITPDQVDDFPVLEGKVSVKARFFPDFYIDSERGRAWTRSREPKRPVFLLSIERNGNIASGFVPMGRSIEFEGYTLEFTELRYWVHLDVSRDSGLPFIFLGFIAIIVGLTVRLALNEKEAWVIINGNKVGIGGRARFFPALFEEELKRLAEEMGVKPEVGGQKHEI